MIELRPLTSAAVLFVAIALALTTTELRAQVPQLINYQGRIVSGTTNFNGTGQFKFALVNANGSASFWSNDGTSSAGNEPANSVPLGVSNGLYSVLLGDTSLPNMTVAIPLSVFNNGDVRLRVWFNDGTHGSQLLSPDQRIAAVGYAMMANNVADGAVTGIKIAPSTITSSNLASGLTLGGTTVGTFSGSLSGNVIGNLALPPTSSSSIGVISQNGSSLLQTFGTQNVFIGAGAGNFTMSGTNNAGTGFDALLSDTSGSFNTASGYSALRFNTTGNSNTATGNAALQSNTIGNSNTASGESALFSNTTASRNVAIGAGALFNQSFDNSGTEWQSDNVAVGFQALYFNQPDQVVTGIENTAVGTQALRTNATGFENTAIGAQALQANSTGRYNTASGGHSLYANHFGSGNTASGYFALGNNYSADANVAIGFNALSTQSFSNFNTEWESANVAVGYEALTFNQPTSSSNGVQNTAIGTKALKANTTGFVNTALGFSAGSAITSGNGNIVIGANAGSAISSGSNDIDIGNAGFSNESNAIRIGSTQTTAAIAGISGASIGSGAAVFVNGGGRLGTVTSSRRFKRDIADMGSSSEALLKLRPVTFRYRPGLDGAEIPQWGLIAEEVSEVNPDLVLRNEKGEIQTVRYEQVNAMLLNEFLKEHKSLSQLKETNARQEQRIDELAAAIKAQAAELARVRAQVEGKRSGKQGSKGE